MGHNTRPGPGLTELDHQLTREWDRRRIDLSTIQLDRSGTIATILVEESSVDDPATFVASRRHPAAAKPAPSPPPPPAPFNPLAAAPIAGVGTATGMTALPRVVSSATKPSPQPQTRPSRAPDAMSSSTMMATLPILVTREATDLVPQIYLGDVLGEGGMGIVWEAEQHALFRSVAVKSVRSNASSNQTTRQLLREARVMGALEHPNILPIHMLGRDEDGRPLIVMKRIDGTGWDELLAGQQSQPGAFSANLEHHLKVLIEVAKATHFAHSHHVIHRDLKPANVMLGGFGEVYVVDWGIAVTTDAENPLRLPVAAEVGEVVGSPAYMAPEMACGNGEQIGPRTDVYLLGAVLCELLTGSPPHTDENPYAMLRKAFASLPPTFPASTPRELQNTCIKALSRRREDRFESAAAFAAELQKYISHRDSVLLVEEARHRLDRLRRSTAVVRGDDNEQTLDLYRDFNACRFGLQSALTVWDGNVAAATLLQETLELMIDYELRRGSATGALALVRDLPEPRPELRERAQKKQREEHAAEQELKRLERQFDPTRADRPRGKLALAIGLLGGGGYLAIFVLLQLELIRATVIPFLALHIALLFVVAAAGAISERLRAPNASGLVTQTAHLVVLAMWAGMWGLGHSAAIPIFAVIGLLGCVSASVYGIAAVAIDRRLGLWSLGGLIWGGLCFVVPALAAAWAGAALLLSGIAMAVVRFRSKAGEGSPLSERWRQAVPTTRVPSQRH